MKTDRDLFIVTLIITITVCIWITFELLKTTKTSTVSQSTQNLIVPLTPAIDVDTLKVLEGKK